MYANIPTLDIHKNVFISIFIQLKNEFEQFRHLDGNLLLSLTYMLLFQNNVACYNDFSGCPSLWM